MYIYACILHPSIDVRAPRSLVDLKRRAASAVSREDTALFLAQCHIVGVTVLLVRRPEVAVSGYICMKPWYRREVGYAVEQPKMPGARPGPGAVKCILQSRKRSVYRF